ncbi:hypothetical protein Hamer_G002315, partial [Homarus americanus]
AERKLSDSTGTRSTPQQQQPQQQKQPLQSTASFRSPHQTLKRLPGSSQAPPKVETLHWKDTPRRDRRASLPSGVKLLDGTTPSLGTLGVPSEMGEEIYDDDDDGSSTSTELCDDDEEEDKLSDLEADPSAEPRPATTSPRLETVHENGKAKAESKKSQTEEMDQDKKQKPVAKDLLLPVSKVQEDQAGGGSQEQEKPETVLTATPTETVVLESKSEDLNSTLKEQESDVFMATDPPLWDFKSMGTGIPLEDLLAGKNLTAAEIIARFPFPSDVSFMKESSEGSSKLSSQSRPGIKGSSPSNTQHNVTPERSPVDSPIPRISSPEPGYESSLTTKPSPNVSPSKSLSSTPSPRGSPSSKASRSPSKSPALSPSQSQDHQGFTKLSLVELPPVSTSDTTQDVSLIPPKSPKITVEDEKSNIFEIFTGHPNFISSHLKPCEAETYISFQVDSALESTSFKGEICPGLPVHPKDNLVNGAGDVIVTSEKESLVEEKDPVLSVLPLTSDNLEKKCDDPRDSELYPDSTKEEFTWLQESTNGSDVSIADSDSTTQNYSLIPESRVFDAICQRLKENVKTESDISEVQTDFATKSGFLCLTETTGDKQTIGNDETMSDTVEKLEPLVGDVKVETAGDDEELELPVHDIKVKTSGCISPSISTPTEALNTKSWLSSLTMTVNSNMTPSATPESSPVTPLLKVLEDGSENIKVTVNRKIIPTTVSVENISSSVISTSEAESTSVISTVDSEFSIFGKTYSSAPAVTDVVGSESFLTKKILDSLATSGTIPLNNGSTFTSTTLSSCVSPTTTVTTVVSPEPIDTVFTFPLLPTGLSTFSNKIDSEIAVKGVETDFIPSEHIVGSGFSVNLQDYHLAKALKTESSSPVEKDGFPSVKTLIDYQIPSVNKSDSKEFSPTTSEEGFPGGSDLPIGITTSSPSTSVTESVGLPSLKTSTDFQSAEDKPKTDRSPPTTTEPACSSIKSFSLVTGPPSYITTPATSTSLTEKEELPLLTTSTDYQISSLNIAEVKDLSSITTKEGSSSTVEFSLATTPATSILTFSIAPNGGMTYSNVKIDPGTSYPTGLSSEESSKTTDTIMDPDTSLENEILSLIGKDEATFSEAAVAKCDYDETVEVHKDSKVESRQSSGLSLEERILVLLGMDERVSTELKNVESGLPVTSRDRILSPITSPADSSKFLLAVEGEEEDVFSAEKSTDIYSSLMTTLEEGTSSPVPTLDRDSSLSASLEGRISLFTSEVKEEGEEEAGACSRPTEDKEDKNSDDLEAEAETDFFNGKDLSSEAIRQRLWKGVKSLSLDADVTLDPNLFCFLIQQSTRRKNMKGGERKMPKRRNSEVALQELVKENTEIIERILKQKSVEDSRFIKTNTASNILVEGIETLEEEMEKSKDIPQSIKSAKEKNGSDQSVEPQSHKVMKTVPSEVVPTAATSESHEVASGFSTRVGVSRVTTQNKVVSPQNSKTFLPERKQSVKKDDSAIAMSPTKPITFNPFPTRNVARQPKEIPVKLGLYSPTKKTSDSSPS